MNHLPPQVCIEEVDCTTPDHSVPDCLLGLSSRSFFHVYISLKSSRHVDDMSTWNMTWNFVQIPSIAPSILYIVSLPYLLAGIITAVTALPGLDYNFFFSDFYFTISFELRTHYEIRKNCYHYLGTFPTHKQVTLQSLHCVAHFPTRDFYKL